MLGTEIGDPEGIEGPAGTSRGLGLLEIFTELRPKKQLRRVKGNLFNEEATIEGYEIHCGVSQGSALDRPFAQLETGLDGAISADNQILGTYVHGLFDHPSGANRLLQWAGMKESSAIDYRQLHEQQIDRLADCIEEHLALSRLLPSTF